MLSSVPGADQPGTPRESAQKIAQTNSNLVWNLDKISNKLRATNFVMQFKRTLCVYSGPVQQLYTNYDIVLPKDDDKLIILPNPFAAHDTFDFVPPDAIRPTGINIIPGDLIGKSGLYMSFPIKDENGKSKTRFLPMRSGLHSIMKRYPKDAPFLPVLTKGDLREFKADIPCVHLHRIALPELTKMSKLELQDMVRVAHEKLATYLFPKNSAPSNGMTATSVTASHKAMPHLHSIEPQHKPNLH